MLKAIGEVFEKKRNTAVKYGVNTQTLKFTAQITRS